MAFVRSKTVNGKRYFQLVRNYREDGKHKQEVLCHIGPHDSLVKAIDYETELVQRNLTEAAEWEEAANRSKAFLLQFYGDVLGGEIPGYDAAWEMLLRREIEDDLYTSISGYNWANENAERCQRIAEEHRSKRDKFVRIQREYP